MKFSLLSALVLSLFLTPGTLLSSPQDDILAAAKKLGDAGGYSWKANREGSRFWRGVVEGKVRKDGAVLVTNPGREDTTYQTAFQGEKSAAQTQDGWQSLSELENEEGFGRFLAFGLRRFQSPAAEIATWTTNAASLELADGVYTGTLKPESAQTMLRFGQTEVRNPAGSFKVWIKDGLVSKYELNLKGNMTFNDNEVNIDRATKIEISNIGKTTFEFPAGAQKKLGGS